MIILKNLHLASRDIARIYSQEGVPCVVSYPFWFIVLGIKGIINGIHHNRANK